MLAAQNLTRTGNSTARVSKSSKLLLRQRLAVAWPIKLQCGSTGAGYSSRHLQTALRVAQIETFGVDATGSLTWDAHKDPNGSMPAASILEGYTLRPGQVPAAAPTSTLPTRPDSLQRSSKPVVLVRDTNGW